MGSFFKTFFASLLALVVFSLLVFFFFVAVIGGIASKEMPKVSSGSVLVLDLNDHFAEQMRENPFGILSSSQSDVPGLHDLIRLINKAKADERVSGIYIIANRNANSFAASEEIRNALLDFKTSDKFILAHGDVITQSAYSVANVADSIYINPQGFMEWVGYSVQLAFVKGTLEKLDIEPQIFYAGKFKSATEPLRSDRMTEENKLQTSVWLGDLYSNFLLNCATSRSLDTATLRSLANEGRIKTANDAVSNKLVDAARYDDQVKDEIKAKLGVDKYTRVNYISTSTYFATSRKMNMGGEGIALIYAEGNIVDGKSNQGTIGSETYRTLIRKARLDKSIKAIVLRINSGGGSALASENILRELILARKDKPVIVSFGDVAASGGYYIACAADSIFAMPTTITGSIGVFGIVPNMQGFFNNKLGITFDGVKTGEYADMGIHRPMTENEKRMVQTEVDLIYAQFKQRVAEGRKRDTAYIETIAQGRVWTGLRAKEIGLIDRFGGIQDAIRAAASMAKLTEYKIREYPEPDNIFETLFGKDEPAAFSGKIKEELGDENYNLYMELKRVKEMCNTPQARLPFNYILR
jgi:protease-4